MNSIKCFTTPPRPTESGRTTTMKQVKTKLEAVGSLISGRFAACCQSVLAKMVAWATKDGSFILRNCTLPALVCFLMVGCASHSTDYKPVIGSYQLPPCKLVLSREDAAKFRQHFQVDTNHAGRFVNLPAGFGVVTFPKAK